LRRVDWKEFNDVSVVLAVSNIRAIIDPDYGEATTSDVGKLLPKYMAQQGSQQSF
jgi:hypothetical protein